MKLLVGLGNPGEKYKNTRHNVGWMVLDAIASEKSNIKDEAKAFLQISNNKQTPNPKFKMEKKFNAEVVKIGDVLLVKPQTFMNSSGEAVKRLSDFYKISPSDIYIIHDDLDIPIGKYKIQFGKGPALHNGILSIEEELGTKDFWRVRVGIENRGSENKQSLPLRGRVHGEVYTLENFTEEEQKFLEDGIRQIRESLGTVLSL